MKNPAESDTLRQLQSLLQSELGAMKIYREASRSVRGGDIERRLAAIARQHAVQAEELRRQIRRLAGPGGASPPVTPEPWAKLSEITETFLNESSGWKCLRDWERLGLQSYRDALDRLDAASREALLGSLIPGQFGNLCAWNDRPFDSSGS